MSQAVAAPITGDPLFTGGKSALSTDGGKAAATIIMLDDHRPCRLRKDVPPFDPGNPAHIRAWESLYDFGRAALEQQS